MTAYDVCVVGLGPVGTVSGVCYAKQGFRVLGIDIDPARVAALSEDRPPFVEPGIKDIIQEVRLAGTFDVSTDVKRAAEAGIIMIAVGTPTGDAPDLTQLDTACAQIANGLRDKIGTTVIVVRSTVPPGTIRRRLTPIIEKISGKRPGIDFHMASNPEFLREGTAIDDFFKTGRIIIGADSSEVAARIDSLYREVDAEARLYVSLESAEFAKYVDNTWHALKVSFANEVGRVCQAFGGKVEETAEIFLSDNRLNVSPAYLRPGFAFGGSCLPKDVRGLSWLAHELQVATPIVDSIIASNDSHIALGLSAILAQRPNTVGILGVAFKEQVDDLRESPALIIAGELLERGIKVLAHDPAYKPGDVLRPVGTAHRLVMEEAERVAERADTLVVMHRLPLYYSLAMRNDEQHVVDLTKFPAGDESYGKNAFTSAKFTHWSLGDAHSGSLPPKNETKKTPSMDMLSRVRKSIFG